MIPVLSIGSMVPVVKASSSSTMMKSAMSSTRTTTMTMTKKKMKMTMTMTSQMTTNNNSTTSQIIRTYYNSNSMSNMSTTTTRHHCCAFLRRQNHHQQQQRPQRPQWQQSNRSYSNSSSSRQGRRQHPHFDSRPSSLRVQCHRRQQTLLKQQQQKIQQHCRRNKSTSMANAQTAPPPPTAAASSSSAVASRRPSVMDSISNVLNTPREIPIPRWISPQRHTFTVSECFGHASFFLVAVSYAVDDFLQLRLIAIAGSSAMLVFTYFHPHGRVLWLPFKWNLMFIALNTWRVAMVYYDQYRSEQLSEELVRVYEHHFYVLEKTDFARLVRLGHVEHFKKGQVLVAQGQDNRYVRLVLKGDLAVDRDGQITYLIHEGNFISEVGLHAGILLRGSVVGCGTVTADSDEVVVLTWDRTELMRLLELHKSIERSLKAVMSWDIVSKLKSQRTLLSTGRIKDPELWTQKRREQSFDRYRCILENVLTHPQYLNERKDELANYRVIHHIELSDHIQCLKQMGWTLKEFEEGTKDGQVDADKLERKSQGMIWWIQSWWNAL